MMKFNIITLLAVWLMASMSQALIINGRGFQQRGFRLDQSGNSVDLVPMGNLPEVVVAGSQQILSISLERRLHAQLATNFLKGGVFQKITDLHSGRADIYVISEAHGKNAKLVFVPVGEGIQLPKPYTLTSEVLGSFDIRHGMIQPFKDVGDGGFLYTFPSNQDGFYDVSNQFSLNGRVPTNMGSAKVEFRFRLTSNMTKPGWIVLRTKADQEVVRLYVPEAAKSGQVVSIIRQIPNIASEKNQLAVVNSGVPMAEFKFRILELKTARNYSAR
ncbi:hypothetical protein B9G69_010835 [Bdellovibrio sp. SKB1291214]|uniref:hypothetical protein n=1 Tax=Bdellovibrio sp. SKB1291214 TaxID=1732569 RepID=UPI002240658A|nr:hypothetical protein [Bdellovibrio sp. SKB1291214]UYL07539.1 hypothetical protein B9G69_010835 [Bdellovibrio sp. SKB1291214]